MGETKGRFPAVRYYSRYARVLLAAALALLSGCAMLRPCEREKGIFYRGKLEQILKAPLARTHEATVQAIKERKLPVMEDSVNEISGRVRSRAADGEPILITLEALGDKYTRVQVRVGLVGDKKRATAFMKLIQTHLAD